RGRVPPERGRAVRLQLRARRRASPAHALRGSRACLPGAARGRARAACVRAGAQGLAHLQPAGCAARHFSDRAPALHPARAHPRERGGEGVSGEPRGARFPAAEERAVARRRSRGMTAERRDFLLEIGTEELPPRSLHALQRALVAQLAAGLDKASLAHGELVGFATPRRIAVWVKRLAAQQPEQHLKHRGPPLNAAFDAAGGPTRAALAFAWGCGTRVEALQRLDEGKGTLLVFLGSRAGGRGHVLADVAARRERIRVEVAAAAAEAHGRALITEALLEDVTALVEWPVALTGRFEERFLSLPREVMICTLEDHQRYFPVEDAHGRLLPVFIAVSNI